MFVKILKTAYGFITLLSLLFIGGVETMANLPAEPVVNNNAQDFRAVWVSTVLNLDWPSKPGLSVAEMKQEADYILDRAAGIGLNAIMFQVRPTGDAFYKSAIFPWSDYLTGRQGLAPAEGFDPLAYWIDGAHGRGMELHAWVNPYRITHSTKNITHVNQLAANNPARINPNMVRTYDRALYYDPGLPESRRLIINGVKEIVENYDVDGIHMDDYFYPGTDFDDAPVYAASGGLLTKDDWRRENVNTLIKELQWAIKTAKAHVRFGVSPAGIWQNADASPLGSATSGFQSYSSIYSDSRRWVKEDWVDYICPQIYWYIGYGAADYAVLLEWWAEVCEGTGVELYIGTAAYREADGEAGWQGEIIRQLVLCENYDVAGHVFFRAGFLNGALGDRIKAYYNQDDNTSEFPQIFVPEPTTEPTVRMSKLELVQPSADVTVSGAKGYYFFGSSDPSKTLYVNGWPVEDRTEEGFFSVYAPLGLGSTPLVFSQDGQEPVSRMITVKEPAGPGTPPAPPVITDMTASPSYAEVKEVNGEMVWGYPGPTTTGGSDWALMPGQRDRIVAKAQAGKDVWYKLSAGCWVQAEAVTVSQTPIHNALSNGRYVPDFQFGTDAITFAAADYPVTYAEYKNKTLTVYFGGQNQIPALDVDISQNFTETMLQSVAIGTANGTAYYTFAFKPGEEPEGYYTEYEPGIFRLCLKKRKDLAAGPAPLTGFSFMLDPGHGGTNLGARGPMGNTMAEKEINLLISQKLASKLRGLGAEVILTRDSDVYSTTMARTVMSREAMPDMYISVHCNSMAEITDSTNIKGLTVWYRNESSVPLAEWFSESLYAVNPGTTRQNVLNQSNFMVCRPAWTPSVLLECSFMNNIYDFSWLIKDSSQEALAAAVASAIVGYYR